MPRILTSVAAAALLGVSGVWPSTAALAQQRPETGGSAGIDFTGVDQLWPIVDLLRSGGEPTSAQWRALMATPGYRLAQVNLGPVMQDDIDLTFKPSRRAEFDRLSKVEDGRGARLQHLALAQQERTSLLALRDSLARATPIADAIAMAARFLPPGATNTGRPPLVAFAIWQDDGYSLPDGIVVDLMNAHGGTLIPILAHEFHHTYVNRLARPVPPARAGGADSVLRTTLYDLRNEGIADLIDKPHPFTYPNPAMAGYVARYNREYDRTPEVIAQLDSLLVVANREPNRIDAIGQQARALFWSNGHPNGSYIAREILETFGTDSLYPAARDPAAFFRLYALAERRRGHEPPFSTEARRVIDRLDAAYWRN